MLDCDRSQCDNESSRRDGQIESLDELKHYLVRYEYENFND